MTELATLMADDVKHMLAEIERLRDENAALRKALRHHCMVNNYCALCGYMWQHAHPEKHAPSCLATPTP